MCVSDIKSLFFYTVVFDTTALTSGTSIFSAMWYITFPYFKVKVILYPKYLKKNYLGTLVPRINAKNACIQQLPLFVWIHYYNYLLLTDSFSCSLSYMQHDYYQLIYYQWVTSYAGSLAIVLHCVRLYVG
jgi:hypothetical protein